MDYRAEFWTTLAGAFDMIDRVKLEQAVKRLTRGFRLYLFAAVAGTIAAVIDGAVAAADGKSLVIIFDVVLFFCAALQWSGCWSAYSMRRTLTIILEALEDVQQEHGNRADLPPIATNSVS